MSTKLTTGLAQNVGFDPIKLALVDEQINADIINGFPGAVLLIIKNNKIIKNTAYGYKLRYTRDGLTLPNPEVMTTDTLFDIASNTKMYATNYALMHLVYTKQININAPIKQYIPQYAGYDKNSESRDTRLVSDLLSHSAGYAPDPQFFNPLTIKSPKLFSHNKRLTESIILERLPFIGPRGGKPIYSDVDYLLLGILIERVSKIQLDEYVKKTIYKPLDLIQTTFNPLKYGFSAKDCAASELQGNTRSGLYDFPNIRTEVIRGEVHDEKAYYSMQGVAGHAGLFSTSANLAVLLQLMLNNGSYGNVTLWDKQVEDMFTTPNLIDDTFALGWRRSGSTHYPPFGSLAPADVVGHTGWTGTLTLVDRKNKLGIVLLTNKKHSVFANSEFVADKTETGRYGRIIDLIYQALNSRKP